MSGSLPYPWQLDSWEQVMRQARQQRLPHALLVSGEEGCGKRHFVDVLLGKLLCSGTKDFACGECKSCLLLEAGTHPGYLNIGLEEKARLIKIDQIRVLVDFISKTAQVGDLKIAVIEPAEQMNANAANALLKCLEEPAGSSLIILVSHAPNRLLPTIRSRCQVIPMLKPGENDADKWLAAFVADTGKRKRLLQLANGNPLLALDYSDREIADLYIAMIGQLSELQSGQGSLVKIAEQVGKTFDEDLLLWLGLQQRILWQLILAGFNLSGGVNDELYSLGQMSRKPVFQKRAFKLLDEIQRATHELQGSSNPNQQLLIESLLIRWRALPGG